MSWRHKSKGDWGQLDMKCELGTICSRLSSGKNLPAKFVYQQGKYPVYGGNGLRGYTDTYNFKGECAIIGRQGAFCGNVRYFQGTGYMTEHAVVACATENNNTRYLAYLLSTMQLGRLSAQSAQPGLSVKTLSKQIVDVPSLESQNKIASILSVLDDKIELNNKINENLQQQATALFDSLYNNADSGVSFTDIIQILGGGTPKTKKSLYWNGNIPFFTPKDVGSPYTLTTEKTITEDGLAHCNSHLYPPNTVFVTARGTVGKVGMAGIPMAMNQSCYALVGKETHQLLVYFYTLKVVDRLKHKASGAVFDAITTRDFESEEIMKLSDRAAEMFLNVAEPIYQAILSNSIENLRLAALRDELLPKLMSGEVDISNMSL